MITEELGISLDKFEEYVSSYKGLLNKYFQEVVEKEKKIKESLEDIKNLRKWVDRVRNFSFSSSLLSWKIAVDLQRNAVEDNLLIRN
jgi:oligoribonuclease NrnB/cAMP/cGMP phosphodiesterase (DHH superfamily)